MADSQMPKSIAKTMVVEVKKKVEKLVEIVSQYLSVNNPSAD
ncbi:MAG: hypothetical protein QXX12_02475 [Nanopusillaceae archaeon]